MADLLFGEEIEFPAGALRRALSLALPGFTWTSGEDDDGRPDCRLPFRRTQLVMGRSAGLTVSISIGVGQDMAGDLPEHRFHIHLGPPAVEDPDIADRMLAVTAWTLSCASSNGCRCRFDDSGPWLDAGQVENAAEQVANGKRLAVALAGMGSATSGGEQGEGAARRGKGALHSLPFDDLPVRERSRRCGFDILGMAETERVMAETLHNRMGGTMAEISPVDAPPPWCGEPLRRESLPTLVLLYDAAPEFDWSVAQQGLEAIDDEGGWQAFGEQSGSGMAVGRGCRITLQAEASPVPAYLVEPALDRSFWCTAGPGLSRLRRHRAWLSIACDLDCDTAEFEDIRQAAKCMAMLLAVAAKAGPCAGMLNGTLEFAYPAEKLAQLVGALQGDEVPIKLFVWTAFPSIEPDAVSLSTAGMLPFVGREIEVWNAPGTIEYVGEKLNGLLRYLLINGPVIRHGDTIGESEEDRSVRIYHGESLESSRPEPVPVLMMEFEGPAGAEPRPDPVRPPPPEPPQASRPAFARRAGGFGRKGL